VGIAFLSQVQKPAPQSAMKSLKSDIWLKEKPLIKRL